MALPNVLIEHLARHDEDAVRDARKDLLCHLHSPTRADGRDRGRRIPPVCQVTSRRAPAILEGDEAGVVGIRATQIELARVDLLSFLNRFPEQEGHPTKLVESLVSAPVLTVQ